MRFFLPIHWLRTNKLPASNYLQISVYSWVSECFTPYNVLLMCNWNTFSSENGTSRTWAFREWFKYEEKIGDGLIEHINNVFIIFLLGQRMCHAYTTWSMWKTIKYALHSSLLWETHLLQTISNKPQILPFR